MPERKSVDERIAYYQGAQDALWDVVDKFSDLGGRKDAEEVLLGSIVKLATKFKAQVKRLEEEKQMWRLFESETEEKE